jgi:hypothetical protein
MSDAGLSPNQLCVLEKAQDCKGVIRRAGGYGGDNTSAMRMGFADANAVDQLIAVGMLASGEYFNVYVVTQRGWNYLARSGQKTKAKAGKKPRAN